MRGNTVPTTICSTPSRCTTILSHKEYVKKAHAMAEHARVGIRGIRRDAIEGIKKLSKDNVPEDEIKTGEAKVQQLTDKYIGMIEKHLEVKEKEIMTV